MWCTPTFNLDPLNTIINNVNNNNNNSKKSAKPSSYTPLTGLVSGTVSCDSSAQPSKTSFKETFSNIFTAISHFYKTPLRNGDNSLPSPSSVTCSQIFYTIYIFFKHSIITVGTLSFYSLSSSNFYTVSLQNAI